MEGRGEIRIRFEVTPTEVITELEDSGKGIAPEIAQKLFEPFATFGKAKGSGLGLAICKKIAEKHNGFISAQSEKGKGSVFTITFPVRRKLAALAKKNDSGSFN